MYMSLELFIRDWIIYQVCYQEKTDSLPLNSQNLPVDLHLWGRLVRYPHVYMHMWNGDHRGDHYMYADIVITPLSEKECLLFFFPTANSSVNTVLAIIFPVHASSIKNSFCKCNFILWSLIFCSEHFMWHLVIIIWKNYFYIEKYLLTCQMVDRIL